MQGRSDANSSLVNARRHRQAPADGIDRQLVERLRADGRQSHRSLAKDLNLNEVTVAQRIRRLSDDEVLRVVALVDIEKAGYGFLTFARIRVKGRAALDVAHAVAALPDAIAVNLCSGRFDVIAVILATSTQHISQLAGVLLPSIGGVLSVDLEIALEILKFESRWAALGHDSEQLRSPFPGSGIESTDRALIDALQINARESNRRVGAAIGLSEGAVRARIKRLESADIIRIQAVCDPTAFGLTAYVYVGLQIVPTQIDNVVAHLLALPFVGLVVRGLRDQIFILAVGFDRDSLMEQLDAHVLRFDGVERAELHENIQTIKHNYLYARLDSSS